jgi:putative ABC transport system substrate-binding protein
MSKDATQFSKPDGRKERKVERLTELAAELAALKLDAIIAFTTPAAIAASKATTTIPIVFLYVGDPVGAGVVPSLARPGGNVTGISLLAKELSPPVYQTARRRGGRVAARGARAAAGDADYRIPQQCVS